MIRSTYTYKYALWKFNDTFVLIQLHSDCLLVRASKFSNPGFAHFFFVFTFFFLSSFFFVFFCFAFLLFDHTDGYFRQIIKLSRLYTYVLFWESRRKSVSSPRLTARSFMKTDLSNHCELTNLSKNRPSHCWITCSNDQWCSVEWFKRKDKFHFFALLRVNWNTIYIFDRIQKYYLYKYVISRRYVAPCLHVWKVQFYRSVGIRSKH